jgi:AcrR family transcriptional regulator
VAYLHPDAWPAFPCPGEQGLAEMTTEISRVAGGREGPPAERLLNAAEELFGERSYHRTTVADICARAGMATGSFYSYFGSKAEIFAAVVRRINTDLRHAIKEALEHTDGGQRAKERASFRVYFDMLSKRPWMDRIVRESEFIDRRLFREYYEHLTRGYARGVRTAQLAREVDAHYDPEVIAFAYTGIGNFVGMRWAEWTAGGRVPEDVLDDVLRLLARGLAPRDPLRNRNPRLWTTLWSIQRVAGKLTARRRAAGPRRRPGSTSAAAGPARRARPAAGRTTAIRAAARSAPGRRTAPSPPT